MRKILPVIFFLLCFLSTPNSIFASTIKLNEFYAAGSSSSSSPDWVEIYNEGNDLSLYQLLDADNHPKNLSGATCNGNFCTIDWSNLLNNGGDTIKLTLILAPDSPIDQVTYGLLEGVEVPSTGQSAGRNPDESGGWVIFSSPSKGTTNNNSVILTSTPTNSPTPTSTVTASPTPTAQSNPTLNVSLLPTLIDVNQSFDVSIAITNFSPNSKYYLKGAFIKSDSTNYFGQTLVSGSWIKNSETYSKQFLVTTDANGNWSGTVSIKGDQSDSGFIGEADYIFKVGYYKNEESSTVSWSNETTIHLTGSVITETPSPTSTNTLTPIKTPTPTAKPTLKPSATPPLTSPNIPASILGTSSANISPAISPKSENQNPESPLIKIFFIGGGLIILLTGIFVASFVFKDKIPFIKYN